MNNLNYQEYTSLPVKVFHKAENSSAIVEIKTPHKGLVIIELSMVDKGLFRKASEVSRSTRDVLNEIYSLEESAKDFLLQEWLNKNV